MTTATLAPGTADAAVAKLFPQPDPYLTDPSGWVKDKLGEHFWSKQQEIGQSVVDNRYTAVQACHGPGKSYAASRLAAWWLDVHPVGEAFVVTTAPTQPQVAAILWREIRRAHVKGGLNGRITLDCQWYMGDNELVAFGRKPADYVDAERAMAAFTGIHARYVLILLDEAGGVPLWLWDAVDSLATNEDARVLAIGNPDDPASQFAKVCAPGSGWHNIQIAAEDTPNFTGEWVPEGVEKDLVSKTWVRERAKRWGKKSARYISKVLGLFPEVSDDTLIPPAWIRAAMERDLPGLEKGQFGGDVARYGDDESVVYRNRGGVLRMVYRAGKQDTMETAGAFGNLIRERRKEVGMQIDTIGLGAGVYDRLREQDLPVYSFNSSEAARNPTRYKNRRAEGYWGLRVLFQEGLVDLDPEDEDLAAQLGDIKWKSDSAGRTVIEPKEDQKKRLGVSPDLADACMYSTAPTVQWNIPEDDSPPAATIAGDLLNKAT